MYRFHPFFGADFFAMSPNTEFYLFYGFDKKALSVITMIC